MRMKSQYWFVVIVVAVIAAYFVVRSVFSGSETNAAQAKPTPPAGPPSVQAKLIPEVQRQYDVVVRGRTQATRTVVVRSETAGNVAVTPVLKARW